MQWLRMLKGLRTIFQMAGKRWLQGNQGAVMNVLVKSASSPSDPNALFTESSRVKFTYLHRPMTSRRQCQREGCEKGEGADDEKMEDPEARDACNKTVSYIGTIHLAIKVSEHDMEVFRRLIAFAVLIPDKMIELIEEKRPRELVILAHYYAVAAPRTKVWWIGDVMRKEVEAIQRWLPGEWKDLMRWPLTMAKTMTTSKGADSDRCDSH